MGLARASYYHKPTREEKQKVRDMELRQWIEDIHVELPGYGYHRIRRMVGSTVHTADSIGFGRSGKTLGVS
jgi:hypothetical protein